ncbi:hypothetical protein HRbin22_00062 [Candidatus Thermoflexus japonica]|uniref:Uncharacterized protein n=1 Tax=Candidatus Thermoflexus japonica TaxID=2035417 RepID=A0A2H5Y330_9CHLR|nr:hypothetical protein HRbin22_00062 [Candidatus Thermoflexus japonica]
MRTLSPAFPAVAPRGLWKALSLTVVLGIAGLYALWAPRLAVFWLFGLSLGVTVQRGRFCFASAFRDLYLLRDGRVVKGIIAGMAVATIGFALLAYRTVPDLSRPVGNVTPVSLATFLGGLLFGIGMVLGGGCASGMLYRIGEGYVASLFTLIGAMIGMFAVALQWPWWWQVVIAPAPRLWLPQALGWGGAVLINLFGLTLFYLAVLAWETRGGVVVRPAPTLAPAQSFAEHLQRAWERLFRHPWAPIPTGITLGVLNVYLFLWDKPWGITTEVSRWAGWIVYLLGYPADRLLYYAEKAPGFGLLSHIPWTSPGTLLNVGLIAGAFLAAVLADEFKIRTARLGRYLQALVGGFLLGYGARIAMGCNIGGFFSAIPSLAVSGWLFAVGLAGGSWIGAWMVRRLI